MCLQVYSKTKQETKKETKIHWLIWFDEINIICITDMNMHDRLFCFIDCHSDILSDCFYLRRNECERRTNGRHNNEVTTKIVAKHASQSGNLIGRLRSYSIRSVRLTGRPHYEHFYKIMNCLAHCNKIENKHLTLTVNVTFYVCWHH